VAGDLTIQGGADADDMTTTGTVATGTRKVDAGAGANTVVP
jgi:hypothetical protein